MGRVFILFAFLLVSGAVHAAKGKITYLPKDGGPPVDLTPATSFGALAGRYSPIIGIATAAAEACIETNCINMLTGQNAKPPPVPGWSDPATPPQTSGLEAFWSWYNDGSKKFSSALSACASQTAAAYPDGPWVHAGVGETYACGSSICTQCLAEYMPQPGRVETLYYVQEGHDCPTGYQYVNNTCTLIPGSFVQWPSDGKPTFALDSNYNWIPHPNDPDTINPATGQPYTPPPSVGSLYSHDEHGNPTETTVTPQPGGGTKTTQKTQGVNPSTGTTDVTVHETTTNNAGDVVNYTYQYHANTTLTDLGKQSKDLTLPDDYARENTLQNTNTKLQSILDEMKKPPEAPPSIPNNEQGPTNENIPLPQISESGPELGSGGCPADIRIPAMGATITVPTGPICTGAVYVGPMILAFAWFLAARIVAGGLPLD